MKVENEENTVYEPFEEYVKQVEVNYTSAEVQNEMNFDVLG